MALVDRGYGGLRLWCTEL